MGLPGEGHHLFGAVKVDIEWHLARHAISIDFVTRKYAAKYHISRKYNPDDYDEIRQAIVELLIKRHTSPSYDHDKFLLWTYVQPALDGVVKEALDPYLHLDKDEDNRPITVVVPRDDEGISFLDALQQRGEATPIDWHGRGYGEQVSSLTPEELELAEKLLANLTDEEVAVLSALVGPSTYGGIDVYRTEHEAARSLDMPWTTYWRKLGKARARAKALTLELGLTSLLAS